MGSPYGALAGRCRADSQCMEKHRGHQASVWYALCISLSKTAAGSAGGKLVCFKLCNMPAVQRAGRDTDVGWHRRHQAGSIVACQLTSLSDSCTLCSYTPCHLCLMSFNNQTHDHRNSNLQLALTMPVCRLAAVQASGSTACDLCKHESVSCLTAYNAQVKL